MKFNKLKTTLIASVTAVSIIAPTTASAHTLTSSPPTNSDVVHSVADFVQDVQKNVENLFAPGVNTTDQHAAGVELTDTLHVSDVPPGVETKFHSILYGPFKEKPAFAANPDRSKPTPVPEGAPKAGEVDTTVTGSGDFKTSGIHISESGWYVWADSSAADEYRSAWNSDFAPESEVTLIKFSPQITTQTSVGSGKIGDKIKDSYTVTGSAPGVENKVKHELYFMDKKPEYVPNPDPSKPVVIPEGAKKVAEFTTTYSGDGTFETPEYTADKSGFLVWVTSQEATGESNAYYSDFAPESEVSLIKWNPKVTTDTSTPVVNSKEPAAGGEGK